MSPEFFSVDGRLVGPVSECDLIHAFRTLHWEKTGHSYNYEALHQNVTYNDPFGMSALLRVCCLSAPAPDVVDGL